MSLPDYQDTVRHYSTSRGGRVPQFASDAVIEAARTVARESRAEGTSLDQTIAYVANKVNEATWTYEFVADEVHMDDLLEEALDAAREEYGS